MFAITAFLPPLLFTPGIQDKQGRSIHGAFVAVVPPNAVLCGGLLIIAAITDTPDTDKDMYSPNSNSLFWSHTLWFMTDYAGQDLY